MKKNPPLRKKLIKKLDTLWSLSIRAKYPKCVVCGSADNLQAHHCIVPKSRGLGVRWLMWNGVTLDRTCHLFKYHNRWGGQGDKVWYERYLQILNQIIPEKEQLNIVEISHQIKQFSVAELQELVLEFEDRLKGTK